VVGALRERFRDVARTVPRSYWYVWWGTLVNRLGGFVVPLLAIYLTKVRGLSVATTGAIVSLFGAGNVIASLAGGWLADHVGRRRTMLLSLFGGAVAMLALATARDVASIAILVGVLGTIGELYRPAVLAFIADVVPEPHRVHAYALVYWVINLAFAIAAVVGGLLADIDFTILFVADAATSVIYGVILLVALPETRPAPRPREHGTTERAWFRDREFVVFAVLSFLVILLPMQTLATLAAHMTWQGFSAASYGMVMGLNGVLIIVLQPMLTAWSASRDASRVLAASALLYGIGIALHGAAGVLAMHALAVVIWTLAEILESPTRSAVVAAMAPEHARGRYQGALVMSWGAAQLVGPTAGTWAWETLGPTVLWASCLGFGALNAIATLVTAPARRRRMAEATTAPSPSGSS
jgi:MFS family permease